MGSICLPPKARYAVSVLQDADLKLARRSTYFAAVN